MMSNSRISSDVVLYTLLIIIVIMCGYWLSINLSYHTVKKDKGYQGEALTNRYLAAEYFLLRMGQDAEKVTLFDAKALQLKRNDTLFIPSIRLAFDSRRSEQILDWVRDGGHLIITGRVEAENDASQRDYILEYAGLSVERQVLIEGSTQDETPVNVSSVDDVLLLVDFDDYLVITKRPDFDFEVTWVIKDEDRIHGLQILLGDGRLTLLSDVRLFDNDYIDKYDHAAFLYLLATTQTEKLHSGVFKYSLYEDQLTLLQWLWKNAQLFVMSCILLFTVVLWMLMPRFGPLIKNSDPVRRRFLDHLHASGNYHWRQGSYAFLLTDVKQLLNQQVQMKYPQWSSLNRQEKILHFADISQIDSKDIEKALFDTEINHVSGFISTMKILEKLRKSL